jgi:peptidoglycan/xylan/chitin deacetylase (PgdA/CDA1 family)
VSAKRLAKQLVARGLVHTGWWSLALGAWARRDTTVILTYHRVVEKWEPALDYAQPGMVVTVPTFERQLAFLKQHFDVVSLGDLAEGAAGRRPSRRPRCVITFDDGWRDNYELAFPVLREHDVPATVFVTTDFIGTERVFWHTELIYLLMTGELSAFLRTEQALAAYPRVVREAVRACAGAGRPTAAHDVDAVVETVKTACEEDRIGDLVGSLARAARVHRPFFPGRRFFLDWDQVRDMAAHGVEIGSHGCSHRILTRVSSQEASQELSRSKAEIEARVGGRVVHFAFPNEDASPALVALAARAGYRTACVGAGVAAAAGGLRLLRRVGMHEGVGLGGPTHDDALLSLCLLRAPKSRPA